MDLKKYFIDMCHSISISKRHNEFRQKEKKIIKIFRFIDIRKAQLTAYKTSRRIEEYKFHIVDQLKSVQLL